MEVRIVHAVANTGGTTQDFVSTVDGGLGTCIGAVFFWCRSTADGSPNVDAGIGMGACDGTREWATYGGDEDGSDPSQCATRGSTANCIVFGDAPNTSEEEVAAFDSFITDGVRLEWNAGSAPSTAYRIMAVLFSDANGAQVEAGTTIDQGSAVDVEHTVSLTDMTLEPEFVLFGAGHTNPMSATETADLMVSYGWATGPESSIGQGSVGHNSDDQRNGLTRVATEVRNDHCLNQVSYDNGTAKVWWEATGFAAGEFSLTKRNAATTASYGYFAVSSNGWNASEIDTVQLDFSSTGDQDYTGASFQADAMLIQCGMLATVNTKNAGALSVAHHVGGVDADEDSEGSYHLYIEETDPNNSNSMFDSQFCRSLTNAGASVNYASTFTQFQSDGFRLNVGNAATPGLRIATFILIGPPVDPGSGRKRSMVCG